MMIRDIKIKKQDRVPLTGREKFLHIAYPAVAGAITSILILYFLQIGSTYEKIISELLSPIITGVVSGIILYILGMKGAKK